MELNIFNNIGVRCLTQDDGQKIYNLIYSHIVEKNDPIILDFKNVVQFASPFFNYAIGQLVVNITFERFEALVKIINLNSIGRNIYYRVIDNARTYNSDPNYQSSLSTALEENIDN